MLYAKSTLAQPTSHLTIFPIPLYNVYEWMWIFFYSLNDFVFYSRIQWMTVRRFPVFFNHTHHPLQYTWTHEMSFGKKSERVEQLHHSVNIYKIDLWQHNVLVCLYGVGVKKPSRLMEWIYLSNKRMKHVHFRIWYYI